MDLHIIERESGELIFEVDLEAINNFIVCLSQIFFAAFGIEASPYLNRLFYFLSVLG